MTDKSNKPAEAATLRQQAEKQFAEKAGLRQPTHKPLSPEESQAALHELEVHQIELEMQNEELRRTQMELNTARKRYFDLYDMAPVGYCTISEKGVILEANLTAASLLGVSRLEMTESPFSHFICKEDQDSLYLHHRRLFAGDDKQDFDLRMLKTDGTSFWAHLTETQAHDAAGLPVARIALTDISDTKQFEEALRKSERNLHLILDSTAEAIYGIDTNGDCTFCNRACLEILGYKNPDELIGKNMHWQIHSMHADGTPLPINECHIFRAFKTGEGTHVSDEVLWRADGTSFPAEYWSYPQYENYVVTGAVVTPTFNVEVQQMKQRLQLAF